MTLKPFNIRLKMTFFIASLLLVLIPVLTFVNMNIQKKSLQEEDRLMAAIKRKTLQKKGIAITQNIALASETAVAGYDFDFLNMVVNTTIKNDEEALYGIITDSKGMVFVHTDISGLNRILKGIQDQEAAKVKKISVFDIRYKNDPVMEIAAPIYSGGEKWGVIRIGFTMKFLNHELKSMKKRLSGKISTSLRNNITIMTLFLLVGILGASIIGGRIALPIKRLTDGAKKISDGNLDERVAVGEKDEIGELAESFNFMAETLQKREMEINKNYKDLKDAYSQLDEYKENLEKKVNERTNELNSAYGKLKNVQETLLNTERLAVVGEMSGRIAHEILNPMTSVLTKVELKLDSEGRNLKRLDHIREITDDWKAELNNDNLRNYLSQVVTDKNTGESRTYADDDIHIIEVLTDQIKKGCVNDHDDMVFILKNLSRIVKIVDELRGMSRRMGSIENVNVNKSIEDAIDILSHGIEKKEIDLVKNFTEDAAFVKADFNELVQIFSNIIKNASQSISEKDEGDKKIIITTALNGHRVEIRIRDTGTGIRKEDIPMLFHVGFTNKSRKEGTGLGLSISQRLIRKFDGEIEVAESEMGKGTTFLIYLPVDTKAVSN